MNDTRIVAVLKRERLTLLRNLKKIDAALSAFDMTPTQARRENSKLTKCKVCGKEFTCFKIYKRGNYCSPEHYPSNMRRMKEREVGNKKDKGTILIPSADRK